jgi:hypothetical protein
MSDFGKRMSGLDKRRGFQRMGGLLLSRQCETSGMRRRRREKFQPTTDAFGRRTSNEYRCALRPLERTSNSLRL